MTAWGASAAYLGVLFHSWSHGTCRWCHWTERGRGLQQNLRALPPQKHTTVLDWPQARLLSHPVGGAPVRDTRWIAQLCMLQGRFAGCLRLNSEHTSSTGTREEKSSPLYIPMLQEPSLSGLQLRACCFSAWPCRRDSEGLEHRASSTLTARHKPATKAPAILLIYAFTGG